MPDLDDVNFDKTLTKLKSFAEENGFKNPWENIYFIESKFIENYYDFCHKQRIRRKCLIPKQNFEKRFEELLRKGHSWINVHFFGVVNDLIIITIEEPNYKNNCEFTSPNLSLPITKIKNWDASEFCEIID